MQAPTQSAPFRSRQRAFRRLARLDALKAVGVPEQPDVLTEPAPVRWQTPIDQAHAALETAHNEMEVYTFEAGTSVQKDWSAIGDCSTALMTILMELDELPDG